MFKILLCHLMVCASASAATCFVSPLGDDRNPGTAEDQPLRVVQHAIERMHTGDTLVVLDGVYTGTLKLKSGITIKAKNPRKVVFSGLERLDTSFEQYAGGIYKTMVIGVGPPYLFVLQ